MNVAANFYRFSSMILCLGKRSSFVLPFVHFVKVYIMFASFPFCFEGRTWDLIVNFLLFYKSFLRHDYI